METFQSIRLVPMEPSQLHHCWKRFQRPRVSVFHLLNYQLPCPLPTHLSRWDDVYLNISSVWEDLRKYREHKLSCWVFFCNQWAPSSKVDEDCVGQMRLQKLTNDVRVIQPVLSERKPSIFPIRLYETWQRWQPPWQDDLWGGEGTHELKHQLDSPVEESELAFWPLIISWNERLTCILAKSLRKGGLS